MVYCQGAMKSAEICPHDPNDVCLRMGKLRSLTTAFPAAAGTRSVSEGTDHGSESNPTSRMTQKRRYPRL